MGKGRNQRKERASDRWERADLLRGIMPGILYPYGYNRETKPQNYTRTVRIPCNSIAIIPERVYSVYTIQLSRGMLMSVISEFMKENRKKAGLTQEEFALRSGLGLRFVRELEQGKETVRLDKVNKALAMFGAEAVPGRIEKQ